LSRTLKLTLQYDGTDFVGWQRQARGTSIQQLLEEAIARIEGQSVPVVGAGRTDAGVHALGQVASARMDHPIALDALQRALNAMLPEAVRVTRVECADEAFHARYSATSKTYRYVIWTDAVLSPFAARYAWQVGGPLDVAAMRDAAARLVGRHDFAAFRASGSSVKTTIRTIAASAFRDGIGGFDVPALLAYDITGDGFLRHMVRNIVGTLVEVGRGRFQAETIETLLASGHRHEAGPTAPARGLWLVKVDYGPPLA
jgi:tRNA pseudouridine38-40 synthase